MGYGGHVAGYSSHPGSSHAALLPPSHRQLMPGAHRIASPTEISQQQQQGSGEAGQQHEGDGPAAKVRAEFWGKNYYKVHHFVVMLIVCN
jgi:hypothetical protein